MERLVLLMVVWRGVYRCGTRTSTDLEYIMFGRPTVMDALSPSSYSCIIYLKGRHIIHWDQECVSTARPKMERGNPGSYVCINVDPADQAQLREPNEPQAGPGGGGCVPGRGAAGSDLALDNAVRSFYIKTTRGHARWQRVIGRCGLVKGMKPCHAERAGEGDRWW